MRPCARVRLALALALLLAAVSVGAPAPAAASPQPAPPTPRAWIVVDGDSGAVIGGGHERDPLPAASIFKVLTALIAVETIPPGARITVSPRAEGMPARKINLKAGQTWSFDDLLHALLLVSANDAAVALAERAGGSEQGFVALLEQTARRLGMEDHPVLHDAAGLDDEFSYEGGNRISPRDLAIATRAALANPQLAAIVATQEYRFSGGDGLPHRLLNHNLLLTRYPGAIGVKTGYTQKAGHCLIAAARRNGRTMVAVVLGAPDPYGFAQGLLDLGFATPPAALAGHDHLPAVSLLPPASSGAIQTGRARVGTGKPAPTKTGISHPQAPPPGDSSPWPLILLSMALPAALVASGCRRRRYVLARSRPHRPHPNRSRPRHGRPSRRSAAGKSAPITRTGDTPMRATPGRSPTVSP